MASYGDLFRPPGHDLALSVGDPKFTADDDDFEAEQSTT